MEDTAFAGIEKSGISWLDGIFISHTDQDHINGVKELLEYMGKGLTTIRAGYLILPAWAERPDAWRELAEAAKTAGVKVMTAGKGDELPCGKVSFFLFCGRRKMPQEKM